MKRAYAPLIGMMAGKNIPIIPRKDKFLFQEAKSTVKDIICTSNYLGYKYNQEIKSSNGADPLSNNGKWKLFNWSHQRVC